MTSLSLLLWIAFGIAMQVALWLAIGFWRHWLDYQALRSGVPVAVATASTESRLGVTAETASVAA